MSRENQRSWPTTSIRTGLPTSAPVAFFQTPDGTLKSDRQLAGPLRLGTAQGVGPKGALAAGSSDFGMDRVSPRGFDPLGTSDTRAPAQEKSQQISRELRRAPRR